MKFAALKKILIIFAALVLMHSAVCWSQDGNTLDEFKESFNDTAYLLKLIKRDLTDVSIKKVKDKSQVPYYYLFKSEVRLCITLLNHLSTNIDLYKLAVKNDLKDMAHDIHTLTFLMVSEFRVNLINMKSFTDTLPLNDTFLQYNSGKLVVIRSELMKDLNRFGNYLGSLNL